MSFDAPVAEQRFVLEHVVRLAELGGAPRFAEMTDETVDAILQGAGRFAEGEWAPLLRIGDTDGPRLEGDGVAMPKGFDEAYRAYVDGGWGTVGFPAEYGGMGLPFTISMAVLETLGGANMALALAPILTGGAVEALSHHGTEAQKARYLPHLVAGRWTGTMNLTEPHAGSDVGALTTTATPRGDGGWSIRGTKIFISFGDHDMADNIIHLVLARTPGAPPGSRGISLFLVPKYRLDAKGEPAVLNDVRVLSIEHKMGLHASPTCVLSFGENGDCIGELVGAEHGGLAAMFTMMNNARLAVGLQGVQVAEAATQRATVFALGRVQSPRASDPGAGPVPIAGHPDVRRMLMRMRAQTDAIRALLYHAAGQVDRAELGDAAARRRQDLLTPLAKSHGTDVGCEVTSIGIQVHGGMGYIEETGAAQHFRDARITPIYEGTNGIQAADLVGRKLAHDGGRTLGELCAEIRAEARHRAVLELVDAVERVAAHLLAAEIDDRLAASAPFLTMCATAVCGWLMERQAHAATGDDPFMHRKRTVAAFYLDQIVPEALGLRAAAMASADALFAIETDVLATGLSTLGR